MVRECSTSLVRCEVIARDDDWRSGKKIVDNAYRANCAVIQLDSHTTTLIYTNSKPKLIINNGLKADTIHAPSRRASPFITRHSFPLSPLPATILARNHSPAYIAVSAQEIPGRVPAQFPPVNPPPNTYSYDHMQLDPLRHTLQWPCFYIHRPILK